jgi:hypothetical protein
MGRRTPRVGRLAGRIGPRSPPARGLRAGAKGAGLLARGSVARLPGTSLGPSGVHGGTNPSAERACPAHVPVLSQWRGRAGFTPASDRPSSLLTTPQPIRPARRGQGDRCREEADVHHSGDVRWGRPSARQPGPRQPAVIPSSPDGTTIGERRPPGAASFSFRALPPPSVPRSGARPEMRISRSRPLWRFRSTDSAPLEIRIAPNAVLSRRAASHVRVSRERCARARLPASSPSHPRGRAFLPAMKAGR